MGEAKEYIEVGEFGYWVCLCGNTDHSEGFHVFNRTFLIYDDEEDQFCRCDRCGRIINAETSEVVETVKTVKTS